MGIGSKTISVFKSPRKILKSPRKILRALKRAYFEKPPQPTPPDIAGSLRQETYRAFRRPLVDQREQSDIAGWLCQVGRTPEFHSKCQTLIDRTALRSITGADEMATISLLIQRLRPSLCLEIGTFFAGTSRVIAEAAWEGGTGRLLTIDPNGGHRVPDILAGWPEHLRQLVEFRPVNSMTVFDDLESHRGPKGGCSGLGLVFVDGNHNFEYALFDIIRAADFLAPGGVIVVDNMDQEGPRQAAVRFVRWNPAWKLFSQNQLFDSKSTFASLDQAGWGVLLAPPGIQISQMAFKFFERAIPNRTIRAIKFNSIESSSPGTLFVKLNYYAMPHDYGYTGTGLIQAIRTAEVVSQPGQRPVAVFESPAELDFPVKSCDLNYELEVLFVPLDSPGGYVLLDKDQPFLFE